MAAPAPWPPKPKPPRIDLLDKVGFIVNYYAQGCQAPFEVFVQFSKEPAHNLFLLLFSIDMEDIVKAWIRPEGARARKAARHGRKHGTRGITLDVNELLGGRARAHFGPYPGIKLPGSRALFRITDQIDAINWTCAIVEGVTDVTYETLWGILTFRPDLCPGMGWTDAEMSGTFTMLGAASPTLPFPFDIHWSRQNFVGPNNFVFTSFHSDFSVAFSGTVHARSFGGLQGFKWTLRTPDLGIIAESSTVSGAQFEEWTLTLSGEVPAGQFAQISRTVVSGSVDTRDLRLFCFTGTML